MPYAAIASRCIEYERIDVASADRPTLIFLHEGLGVDLDVERFPHSVSRMRPRATRWCIRATDTAVPNRCTSAYGARYA